MPKTKTFSDREPITLDNLGKWKLADELLKIALTQGSIEPTDALLRARAGGAMPLGTPGEMILDERTQVVQ